MLVIRKLAIGLISTIIACTTAAPVITVRPGDAGDIIITEDNTLNATAPAPVPDDAAAVQISSDFEKAATNGRLPLSLVNNFGGGQVNAYITGLDAGGRLVMLQPNGKFYFPTADRAVAAPRRITANTAIPLGAKGSTTRITIPGYISSARIYFAEGRLDFYTIFNTALNAPSLVEPSAVNPLDPSAGVNWGFVELTNIQKGGLYANISYVDFVGLVLGMKLESGGGRIQVTEGLKANAVTAICSELKAQGRKDGQPWGDLCMVNKAGKPLRVLAPSNYVASKPTAFKNYWTQYIDQVWTQYARTPLTINTQAGPGEVKCTVSNGQLKCNGDNRGYNKPTAHDLFGCNSGPFGILAGDNDVHKAVVPRLCAAFHRGTLLKTGGHIQPGMGPDNYYTSMPTNWYSKFVHQYEVDGKGYAFPYDDVNPAVGVDQAGVVADPEPRLLTVVVGGPL